MQIIVSCAQCAPWKASVLLSFLLAPGIEPWLYRWEHVLFYFLWDFELLLPFEIWSLSYPSDFELLLPCKTLCHYLIPCTSNDSADAHPPTRDRQILSFCILSPSPKYDSANHLVRPKAGSALSQAIARHKLPHQQCFATPRGALCMPSVRLQKKQICPDLNILSAVSYLI